MYTQQKSFIVLLFILLLFALFVQEHAVKADLTPQKYINIPPSNPVLMYEFNKIAPFNKKSFRLEDQPEKWRSAMSALGQQLELAKVRSVYFVHGTFVGNDPAETISWVKQYVYPELSPEYEKTITNFIKKVNDKTYADVGNYTDGYVGLFKKAIGNKIHCENFIWSSANYHLARLEGVVCLTKALAWDINQRVPTPGERILLIGHSHAGQLFALLTNFLAQSPGIKDLRNIINFDKVNCQDNKEDIANFDECLQKIRQVQLDIVTFGTPPRYGWGDGNYRLLNIINHRGKEYTGGSLEGVLWTKDGDYIQQWGIAGSDSFVLQKEEENKKLDILLGDGCNINSWKKNAEVKMRVPHYGKTLLVDYKDNSWFWWNAHKTLFGHGVYTQYEKMLFNTQLIVDELYLDSGAGELSTK
ncbi:MAG: hypothetical protein E3K36_14575 [Candidatus Brocadia sp.]|nr:hypothetical protein [Candidatus Brocadia sp.]